MDLALRLRHAREFYELTLDDCSKLLNYSKTHINDIELKKRTITGKFRAAILRTFPHNTDAAFEEYLAQVKGDANGS